MRTEDSFNDIFHLNVGGTHYYVARDTLERCEGSLLASLISIDCKEDDSDDSETIFIEGDGQSECNNNSIFIDRNGRLFEYVLDYLRTSELNLPSSVSRAAVKKEFEYYGLDTGLIGGEVMQYDSTYFLEAAEQLVAERTELAAMNAAKKCSQYMKGDQLSKHELVFFIMLEYYKISPSPQTPLLIAIPQEYRRACPSPWVKDDLRKRGFEVVRIQLPFHDFITIQSVPKIDETV